MAANIATARSFGRNFIFRTASRTCACSRKPRGVDSGEPATDRAVNDNQLSEPLAVFAFSNSVDRTVNALALREKILLRLGRDENRATGVIGSEPRRSIGRTQVIDAENMLGINVP